MGHVNSSQGNPDRCVSQAESGLDLKTNGNIVHNEVNMGKCPPMLEVMKVDSDIAMTDHVSDEETVVSDSEDQSAENLDVFTDEENLSDQALTRTVPAVFCWEHGGKDVYLSGSFSDWNTRFPMTSSNEEFETIIELPEGIHEFKYLVDGKWVHNPNLPTTNDTFGGRNNVVTIKKSDFEVMSALNSDDNTITAALHRPTSIEGSYGQLIPSHHTPMVVREKGVHSSVPPALPPHLLNVHLNKQVPNVNEPSLLLEPNHVSVNHLYALSIKDGVMVVSSCIRYRQKFITTLLYRPVTMPRR